VLLGARRLLPPSTTGGETHENLCLRPGPRGIHRRVCDPRVVRHVIPGRLAAVVHDKERMRGRGSGLGPLLGRLHVVVPPPPARFPTDLSIEQRPFDSRMLVLASADLPAPQAAVLRCRPWVRSTLWAGRARSPLHDLGSPQWLGSYGQWHGGPVIA